MITPNPFAEAKLFLLQPQKQEENGLAAPAEQNKAPFSFDTEPTEQYHFTLKGHYMLHNLHDVIGPAECISTKTDDDDEYEGLPHTILFSESADEGDDDSIDDDEDQTGPPQNSRKRNSTDSSLSNEIRKDEPRKTANERQFSTFLAKQKAIYCKNHKYITYEKWVEKAELRNDEPRETVK